MYLSEPLVVCGDEVELSPMLASRLRTPTSPLPYQLNNGQTQALALTRSKSPEIIVKKELSLSPAHHQQLQQQHQAQQQQQLHLSRESQSASSTSSSTGGVAGVGGGGGGSGCVTSSGGGISNNNTVGGNGNILGSSEKSSHQTIHHHQHPLANNPTQPIQQQSQSTDHDSRSPRYGRRSSEASPVPAINEHASIVPSSQSGGLMPLATTPKLNTSTSLIENGPIGTISGNGNTAGVMLGGVPVDRVKASPSMERRDFDMTKVNSKVPLHCIVESVHSLQASLTIDTMRNMYKRRPNIETDCYVIVEASTLWTDIVSTALQKLGYSIEVASTARGSLIIKNWKPIPLENISDNPVVQVGDILGELASVVTLRIVILRAKPSTFGEIKDKLLKLLVLQSHAVLRSTGCPLDEVTLSQICRSSYQSAFGFSGEVPDDVRRKFDQWWSNQLSPQSPIAPKILPFMAAAAAASAPPPSDIEFNTVGQVAAAAAAAAAAHGLHTSREALLDNHHPPPPPPHHHHPGMMVHPAMHTMHHHASFSANQKTRMRTSFDPEMELPKLQKWFQENPHPSRQQIQTYVMQLNALESRRGRKPLDVNNVVYWFKNARAAQKRAEVRGCQIPGSSMSNTGSSMGGPQSANGYLSHHAQQLVSHDYLKSPLSLKSEDIDTMSQHSDDMDDDQSRPLSPQLPLSLTMHERNRSPEEGNISAGKSNDSSNHNGTTSELNTTSTNRCNIESIPNGEVPNISHDRHSDIETHSHHEEINNDINSSNSHNNNNNNSSSRSIEDRCDSPKASPKSEDLDMDDDNDTSQMDDFRTPSPDRKDISFPMVPNSMFSQSFMYMSHYMPGFGQPGHPHHAAGGMPPVPMGAGSLNLSNLSNEERRKRNRTFIDPVTEVPKLEQWFSMNTHPSHNLILKYTEDLNTMPYRQKFPRLESKNVQFWFKNRRAKCKRLKMSLYDSSQCSQLGGLTSFVHKYDERD